MWDSPHKSTPMNAPRAKRRANPWTVEEHALFVQGLAALGKGNWSGISRHFVRTRTPTQVASHAQKYFIRISRGGERKRRRQSIFDISRDASESSTSTSVPIPPQMKPPYVANVFSPPRFDANLLWWWSYWAYLQTSSQLYLRATVRRPTPVRRPIPLPMQM